ncbi:Dor1-like family protein [Taphrina deformans PYCC 5710]|uniref:Conserved oligomeric Golgi complex subunit 8 n=1 Tax=Taphrina deformans (strain PYCC 5710 / ATCC 11124 / CBS 356.35 / IMI 108563 / JCM 9778 / NBRC 8474) TaxID=1097556 RepID=R4XHN8_TAPDE|nr:Dor1-like family protein [Taphrina deformans PYCC 5710]|eukprot:CCG82932.1 Dor1-like family protein [Taphrina deformans PYCC 5710]
MSLDEDFCHVSVVQINTQTTTLRAESESVNKSLTALALRESDSLTSSTAGVLDPLTDVITTVTSLEAQIPAIDQVATFNPAKLQQIAQSRKHAALLNRNEGRLQELLDIPDLIKTCVYNGHYTEASDLALYLSRVQARHPESGLLKSVVKEADAYLEQMALQLLALLNTPLKLAMALKVIGFLRRTGSFEEEELRFLFLKGRYDALIESYATIAELKTSPEKYVFAIITQYTSIFPANESVQAQDKGTEAFEHSLLPYFSQRVIVDLQQVIKEYVPQIESQTTKNTLLTQMLYTSQSLARLGCEFINLVIEHFGDASAWSEIVVNQRQMATRLE